MGGTTLTLEALHELISRILVAHNTGPGVAAQVVHAAVEYDDLSFEAVEPGARFLERSTMGTQRSWEHARTIEAVPGALLLAGVTLPG